VIWRSSTVSRPGRPTLIAMPTICKLPVETPWLDDQFGIGRGRPIPRDHLELAVRIEIGAQSVQQMEQPVVDPLDIAGPEFAQQVVDLRQPGVVVIFATPEPELALFVGVQVIGGCASDRTTGSFRVLATKPRWRPHHPSSATGHAWVNAYS